MSNNLFAGVRVQFAKDNKHEDFYKDSRISVNGADFYQGTYQATGSLSLPILPRGDVGTIGYIIAKNKSKNRGPVPNGAIAENEAVFIDDELTYLCRLPPGEIAMFRPAINDFYCLAPNGDCEIEYLVIGDDPVIVLPIGTGAIGTTFIVG